MTANLQTQLLESYEQHPRFRFDGGTLELDPATLATFDDAFEYTARNAKVLHASGFAACRARCERALDAVFESLTAQASLPLEADFLAELRAECHRLLDEELAFHRKAASTRGIAWDAEHTQLDAMRLQRDRHYFGLLRPDAVAEINAIGAPSVAEFRQRAGRGRLTRDDLSVNTGTTVRRIAKILNREFADLGVLDALGAYMGRRMSVSGLALELSVPQAQWWANSFEDLPRAPHSLYAHLDESVQYPKAIVYLSDVDRSNGPTSCYPHAFEAMALRPLAAMIGRVVGNIGNVKGSSLHAHYAKRYHQSMSSEPFRRHFMRLPRAMRFNSHFGWDVMPESAVERALDDCEAVMLGPAGTFIVFDGAALLHRGGMVEARDRVALQVVFSDVTRVERAFSKIRRMVG